MSPYWIAEVKQTAGSTSATSIYSRVNDRAHAIKVISCTAASSGAVNTNGIRFYRERSGKLLPVHKPAVATVATGVTVTVSRPFLLLPGERICAVFDTPNAATDVLELVAYGEYVDVID